jgi:hypothetical protein
MGYVQPTAKHQFDVNAMGGRIEQLADEKERLLDVLKRVEDNLQAVIAEARACPFCDSSVHEDGDISHDEDCSAPYIDQALGRTTNEPE